MVELGGIKKPAVEENITSFEELNKLVIEKKHQEAFNKLLLELEVRSDPIDKGVEQVEALKKVLLTAAKIRGNDGDPNIESLIAEFLRTRESLDWLVSQKELAYVKFIVAICKGEKV